MGESAKLEKIKAENDAALARLQGMGATFGGIDSQYLVILLEYLVQGTYGAKGIHEVQMAHAEWLQERLATVEEQMRQRMLTAGVPFGQPNGAGPASPFPRR